jgi:hypothetical protein
LFLRVFEFFYYTIKIEKYFFIPALFSNDKWALQKDFIVLVMDVLDKKN